MDSSTRKNYDPIHCQPPVNLENDSKVYIKNSKNISNSTSMPNEKIEALEMQVSKLQSQLAQVENGYKSDRDITKQSYDSRIEVLCCYIYFNKLINILKCKVLVMLLRKSVLLKFVNNCLKMKLYKSNK